MINKCHLIAQNFDQAANKYMQLADIQISPALKIIHLLEQHYRCGRILDLGSGPGTLQHKQSATWPITAFDLSLGMLKQSNHTHKVNGNATNLPFANDSFSMVISNLMLQWPEGKLQVLKEVYRVIEPGGKLILTTLIKPSLQQLQQAWLNIDDKPHTLNFLSKSEYITNLLESGFNVSETISWQQTVFFPDLITLFRHFKDTGTNLDRSHCNNGLGGRQKLRKLNESYQKREANGFLPLTYAYLLITANKKENL